MPYSSQEILRGSRGDLANTCAPAVSARPAAEKEKLAKKLLYAKTAAQKAQAEYDSMDNSMQHIMKLCKFIKLNSNLMHLNLSGMGLTQ